MPPCHAGSFPHIAGALFATHPVHCESVAGLVGRADVLAAVFFFTALLLYASGCDAAQRNAAWVQILYVCMAMVAVGLSVLCKEIGITAVAVACVYDILVVYQIDLGQLIGLRQVDAARCPKEANVDTGNDASRGISSQPGTGGRTNTLTTALPSKESSSNIRLNFVVRQFFLLVSFVVIMIVRLQMNGQDIQTDAKTNPANHITHNLNRVLTKNLYVALHAWLLVYPVNLCCDWSAKSIDLVQSIYDARNCGTLLLYIVLVAFLVAGLVAKLQQRSRAELLVAAAMMVVPFIPASGLFMEVGFVLAERVLYIPSAGYCVLMVIMAQHFSREGIFRWRSRTGLVMTFVLVAYSARTFYRNKDWRNEGALFGSGVKVAPNNAKLHHNYHYAVEGETREFHLREAIRLYPPYISAYINLGVHLSRSSRLDEAVVVYRDGLKMHREYPLYSTDVGIIFHNMGQTHVQRGDHPAAFASYTECLQWKPHDGRCQEWADRLRSAGVDNSGGVPAGGRLYGRFAEVPAVGDTNYTEHRQAHPKTFMMFYGGNWCSHCNDMKKDFADLWLQVKDSEVDVAAMDCTAHPKTCEQLSISGYPEMRYFGRINEVAGVAYPQSGSRTAKDMLGFVEHQLGHELSSKLHCVLADLSSSCSEKERSFIAKMKTKSIEELAREMDRLTGLKSQKMADTQRSFLSSRMDILEQLVKAVEHDEL